ncbi:hypothetical protein ASPWEDRAFT_38786 [Aspergillus wentii DTO 134E9]|uniref:CSC1/OSCA1-like 7TM region domain-containing protein n=1 Tax=Aspergillus wentii DTO 134E9 TaxID=1073089 RepID=A0A1L9RQI2_ASPWE|nr:uncharacterized protein ASPWEDRAFT_38786 [Aspergillus wentii DTO 134E9]KAI9928379.1 hypothetical protein MW887_002418 [Aspergillus wentii]OJJ37133.1 hypothetical protein ASPWEDRAFT_38786 [Aspergillus wentii DTO 134E9]
MATYDAGLDGLHQLTRRADEDVQSTSSSASGLVSTLVVALIPAVAFVILFVILRKSQRRMYMPRTYVGSLRETERTPDSPTGLWDWVVSMYRLPDEYVLQHHSMDAYLLIRFLKVVSMICFVGCCITFPILFPVNATGGAGNQQLDLLSISNVGDGKGRYFAHAFVAWIFLAFVFFTITRESIFYINLRQAYSLSPAYASRMSSRTVLFTAVTEDYLNRDKIRRMFGTEKVKNVWLTTDTKELAEKVEKRDDAAMKLEGAETKLIMMANGNRLKALKKREKSGNTEPLPDDELAQDSCEESGSVAARWVKASDRPTHRLKMLIGKKVDTINWARSEIERLTPEIEELQAKHRAGDAKLVTSVFVEFYHQTDAQLAYQSVAHNLPLHMAPRYIGLDPTQVIWSNLRIKWWERLLRYGVTMAFVVALIVFWTIPVAVVGAISNINSLTNKVHFLRFINNMPSFLMGIITNILPTVLQSILMALLPIILRLMAKLSGDPTLAAVELTVQNWYFAFQVIQTFLVVTVASSASSVASKIASNPSSAATLLANNIPKASNFYISYIILQGLSFSAGALLQIGGLIVGKILGKLFDTTPRKIYTRWSLLAGLGWGTVYPVFTLLVIIAITYSCIQPLVLGFSTIGLYLFYFAYRYNMLYVSNADIDTQGKSFYRGLQHITVGCYLLNVCLIGLFAIGTASDPISVGPLILMIISLVATILYHMSLNNALEPLINFLPKNLEHEEEALLSKDRKLGNSVDENSDGPSGSPHDSGVANVDSAEKGLTNGEGNAPDPNANFIIRWFRPDIYSSYEQMRRWAPRDEATTYPPEVERNAYFHPSVNSPAPLLWIPRDPIGVSKQEVEHTMKVIPITDEDAWLDEKNKICWDMDKGEPPIYEEKIYY